MGVPPAIAALRRSVADLDSAVADLVAATDTGPDSLHTPDASQIRDAVAALRQVIDSAEARWSRLLAGLIAAEGHTGDPQAVAANPAAWLRTRCRLAGRDASVRARVAIATGQLPQAATAFAEGAISAAHMAVIADAARLETVPDESRDQVRAVVDKVLTATAREIDPATLRKAARHLAAYADPDGQLRQHEETIAARWLSIGHTADGDLHLRGHLDSESAAVLLAALEPLREPAGPDDQRTARQRNADALTDIARRSLDSGGLPMKAGRRPHLTLLAHLRTLTGGGPANLDTADGANHHDDTTDPAAAGRSHDSSLAGLPRWLPLLDIPDRPGLHQLHELTARTAQQTLAGLGVLDHGGTVPAVHARRIACDCLLTRVLIDSSNLPIDVGRTTRTIPIALRTALIVRDGGCVAPGCTRPASQCDAHHIVHWADGGPTNLTNTCLLCAHHHRLVHHEPTVEITPTPAGGFTLTCRDGPPARSTDQPDQAFSAGQETTHPIRTHGQQQRGQPRAGVSADE